MLWFTFTEFNRANHMLALLLSHHCLQAWCDKSCSCLKLSCGDLLPSLLRALPPSQAAGAAWVTLGYRVAVEGVMGGKHTVN